MSACLHGREGAEHAMPALRLDHRKAELVPLPVRRLDNGLTEEVVDEDAARECSVGAHASTVHESTRRFSVTT